MTGALTTPAPAPWDSLAAILGFSNDDDAFWWNATAPVLGKFLRKANYPLDQQYGYLSWYHRYVLPAYGPRPQEGRERTWRAQCTPNASPFQPSWNLQDDKSTLRFTIEPIGHGAGARVPDPRSLAMS